MKNLFSAIIKGKTVRNFHFWAIVVIALFLTWVYQAWPWTVWVLGQSPWRSFPWLSSLYGLALIEFINRIIGVLFLIPIFYALACFLWRGALAVSIVAVGAILPILIKIWSFKNLVTNVIILLLPLAIILLITIEIEWRRKEKRIFAEREEEQKTYILKILDAQESERQRIAQELHDDTIQTLLVIANSIQNLIDNGGGDVGAFKKNLNPVKDMTLETVENVRRISLNLRPSIIDNLGLIPALRWLADRMINEYNIDTKIIIKGTERKLTPQVSVAIFRVAQEALNNIRRHANAKQAVVTLEFASKNLIITLQDNGQGFYPPRKVDSLSTIGKLGLVGIQQRISSLGGTFKIFSEPGKGTSLLIKAKL